MKIQINNKSYELDLEQAKSLGILKPIRGMVTSFKVGDVFGPFDENTFHSKVVILQNEWRSLLDEHKSLYNLGGYDGCRLYSTPTMSKETMLEYLNDKNLVYLGNINKAVNEAIENCKLI